jgi:phosphoribosyl-ATP pyrophosphohydrolase
MTDSLNRLHEAVLAIHIAGSGNTRTAKLLLSGRAKMAKKVAVEAAEVVIDAVSGRQDAMVRESADLLYNLVVLWVSMGIRPQDVWNEMERRERLLGLAEKMPKTRIPSSERRQVIPLQKRQLGKTR